MESKCEIVVLVADGDYIQIYAKDQKVIELMYENALNQGFMLNMLQTKMMVEHVCQYSSKLKGERQYGEKHHNERIHNSNRY